MRSCRLRSATRWPIGGVVLAAAFLGMALPLAAIRYLVAAILDRPGNLLAWCAIATRAGSACRSASAT